jgi:hypothetical protein
MIVLDAGKFIVKVLADLVSGKNLLYRWCPLLCPHMVLQGIELRASHLALCRVGHTSSPFALVIFEIRSCFMPGLA